MEDTILLISIIALINVLSFTIGAKVGQKVVRHEPIELPKLEPVKAVKEFNERREVNKEQERDKIIAANIDAYNGTPYGQQDIPK